MLLHAVKGSLRARKLSNTVLSVLKCYYMSPPSFVNDYASFSPSGVRPLQCLCDTHSTEVMGSAATLG